MSYLSHVILYLKGPCGALSHQWCCTVDHCLYHHMHHRLHIDACTVWNWRGRLIKHLQLEVHYTFFSPWAFNYAVRSSSAPSWRYNILLCELGTWKHHSSFLALEISLSWKQLQLKVNILDFSSHINVCSAMFVKPQGCTKWIFDENCKQTVCNENSTLCSKQGEHSNSIFKLVIKYIYYWANAQLLFGFNDLLPIRSFSNASFNFLHIPEEVQ